MVDRVLFVTEKYMRGGPMAGLSPSQSFLVGPLLSTGLVSDYQEFRCSEAALTPEGVGHHLFHTCAQYRPSLVIFTPVPADISPEPEVFRKIHRVLGANVFMQFGDSVNYTGERELRSWLPFVTHFPIIDSVHLARQYANHPKFVPYVGTPIAPKDFSNEGRNRDINISFLGNLHIHPSRNRYLTYLKRHLDPTTTFYIKEPGRISLEEFAQVLNRSKITLNFSTTCIGKPQLKGRVYEAMHCGALVLEDYGHETAHFFEPKTAFATFTSPQELVQKVRYYLTHESERAAIASAGHQRVTTVHNARNLWAHALSGMGFAIPNTVTADPGYQRYAQELYKALSKTDSAPVGMMYPTETVKGFIANHLLYPIRTFIVERILKKILGKRFAYLKALRRKASPLI